MPEEAIGASFRDPSGFVFEHAGTLYRQVNQAYAADYEQLMSSGLYDELVTRGLLVAHEEVSTPTSHQTPAFRTLRPELVPFVSYPYEWCFSQLKDAALVTLEVQQAALRHGMILKDASAYNVQFMAGRPVFIDTLSFARYVEGTAWVGYRQYCQHFLAPLALATYRDPRLLQLLRIHLDGIPLDLARSLLPARASLNIHLWIHIRIHANYQRRYAADTDSGAKARSVSKQGLTNLIAALARATRKLDWKAEGTEWADYYDGDSYDDAGAAHKRTLVESYLAKLNPRVVWDLGANTGVYSRIAAARGIETIAFDIDPACVERNYRRVRSETESHILPLLLDLNNPSPALGWSSAERRSLDQRVCADAVMALALIHHIALSNNVPLERIAALFARLAPKLIIEFVPKSDAKVRVLLATREDVFPAYTESGFESAFAANFEILHKDPIDRSDRTLYCMRRKATWSA